MRSQVSVERKRPLWILILHKRQGGTFWATRAISVISPKLISTRHCCRRRTRTSCKNLSHFVEKLGCAFLGDFLCLFSWFALVVVVVGGPFLERGFTQFVLCLWLWLTASLHCTALHCIFSIGGGWVYWEIQILNWIEMKIRGPKNQRGLNVGWANLGENKEETLISRCRARCPTDTVS